MAAVLRTHYKGGGEKLTRDNADRSSRRFGGCLPYVISLVSALSVENPVVYEKADAAPKEDPGRCRYTYDAAYHGVGAHTSYHVSEPLSVECERRAGWRGEVGGRRRDADVKELQATTRRRARRRRRKRKRSSRSCARSGEGGRPRGSLERTWRTRIRRSESARVWTGPRGRTDGCVLSFFAWVEKHARMVEQRYDGKGDACKRGGAIGWKGEGKVEGMGEGTEDGEEREQWRCDQMGMRMKTPGQRQCVRMGLEKQKPDDVTGWNSGRKHQHEHDDVVSGLECKCECQRM
eukprot:2039846-Rhodomonas_salina.1